MAALCGEKMRVEPLWRLFLFDGPRLQGSPGQEVRRFRSQRAAALLAYLALRLGRDVPREELAEALWPEEDPKITANRLRVTLTSLRHQIELPGMAPGSVLDASRGGYLRLRAETVWCDAIALDSALKRGDKAEAAQLVQGTLLPGFWDEWILTERERFEALKDELPQPKSTASHHTPAPDRTEASSETSATPLRHLPLYLTSFVGREQELENVLNRLTDDKDRLVILTGLGGNGKTRLAVEVARRLPAPWGVWFVSLADLWQGERLADALRAGLGLTAGTDEPLEQLVGFLNQQKQPVLVLDNLEQIALRAGPVLRELLTRVPTLRMLVTSRRRLEISGETEVTLAPLEPPSTEQLPQELLLQNPALRLFLDRTREVRPDFTLTAGNTEPICALCRLLEGIPLGLELAAARMASLSPTQLHERLKQHWDDLEAGEGRSRKEDRHRSLRAVVEWSVALLPADARRLFVRLAHFAGGATLEAIEEVCETTFALDTLTRLRASSLLQLNEQGHTIRATMLEVLRQWALEQLSEPEFAKLADRHGAWVEQLVCEAYTQAELRSEALWAARLDNELSNLRQALEHAFTSNPPRLLALVSRLGWYWESRGYSDEGVEWLQKALTLDPQADLAARLLADMALLQVRRGESPAALALVEQGLARNPEPQVLARLMHVRAYAYFRSGQPDAALEAAQQALLLVQPLSLPLEETRIYAIIGAVLRDLSRFDDARSAMERAVALGRSCESGRALAGALNNLAGLNYILGKEGADALFAEAASIYSALGFQSGVAVISMNRAVMASRVEHWKDAEVLILDAIARLRPLQERRHLASALSTLAQILTEMGRLPEALEPLQEALETRWSLGNPHSLMITLLAVSRYFYRIGRLTEGALFLGMAQFYRDTMGRPLPPDEAQEWEQHLASFPVSERETNFEAGRTLTPEAREKKVQEFLAL